MQDYLRSGTGRPIQSLIGKSTVPVLSYRYKLRGLFNRSISMIGYKDFWLGYTVGLVNR